MKTIAVLTDLSATQPYITEEVIRDGTFTRVIYTFYSCLSVLALASSDIKPTQVHSDYAKRRQKIKQWFALCPENFAMMWYLLEAEEARLKGQDSKASDKYALALHAAQQAQRALHPCSFPRSQASHRVRANAQPP